MTDMRSQPSSEGSITPTDDEIYAQMLGTRLCYVRSLAYGYCSLILTLVEGWHPYCLQYLIDRSVEAGYWGSTASSWVDYMRRWVSAAPNLDDGADGVDGVDDIAGEAAAGRSELFRVLSFPSSFSYSRCQHLMASFCSFLFLFQISHNFNLI